MQSTLIVFKGAAEQGRSVGDTKEASIATLLDKSLREFRGDRARVGLRGRTAVDPVALRVAAGADRAGSGRGGASARRRRFGRGACDIVYRAGPVAGAAGFGLGIDAGTFRLVAAAIMIVLGAILLVPSWQARLAAAGRPISGWADRLSVARPARDWRASSRSGYCSARSGRPGRSDPGGGLAAGLAGKRTCRRSRSPWRSSVSARRCR